MACTNCIMYETFYHLTATPFRLTPDPRFCFSHSGYAEARAYLQYAFKLGEGFIILTGRPGAGKTTLIESFLKELEASNVATATIVPANLETTDLLRSVAYVYGIQAEGLDKATLLRRIAQYFSTEMHRGRRVLLVIDEAQGLSHSALEELRLLADMQRGARPLLQIFLVGQEKLRSLMREPEMEQLQQRVIGTCRLGPMGLAETKNYIRHRLCRSGWTGDPELTGAAVLAIFQYTGGVPRHINKMCTRLLLYGFLQGQHILDKEDVVGIASELDEEHLSPVRSGQISQGETEGDAELDHSSILSDLEVRALQCASDELTPSAQQKSERCAAALNRRSEPASAEAHRRAAPRPQLREYYRPNAVQPGRAVNKAARYKGSILTARVLTALLRLQEKPALLFGVVAVVTVSIGSVTSYVERRSVEQSKSYVVNSQPLHTGSYATHDGVRREASGSQDVQPQWRRRDIPVMGPDQGVDRPVAGVATHEKNGVDISSQALQLSAPESAAPVRISPAAAAGQDDSRSDGAAQPGVHDDESGTQDSASSVASVALEGRAESLPVRLSSDDRTQVVVPSRSADSTSPDLDTAVTDASRPVAGTTVLPADGDLHQSTSSGQAVNSMVSANERISRLLILAKEALREDHLMIPARRSAYRYYQQVLSLEPGNAEALRGLGKIVERYVTLTRYAIQRQDKIRANRYITRALRVRPGDAHLLALKDSMKTAPVSAQPEPPAAPLKPSPQEAEEPRNIFQRLKDFFSGNSPESP